MPNTFQTRRKYKKDFLDRVIARIDFDSPIPISEQGPPQALYDLVRTRFPIPEKKKILARELIIGPASSEEQTSEKDEWYYYGRDREKFLKIASDHMAVEYRKYEYYEPLRNDFISVSSALFDAFPTMHVRRLGLRYIDAIELPEDQPTNWKAYFAPPLVAIFELTEDRTIISRAFHDLELNFGESSLRFQFGMFNPDYPSPIKRKLYILDHDMYCDLILDALDISRLLDDFHARINASFESVITDNLRTLMGIIND